jgi:hypothetical protein
MTSAFTPSAKKPMATPMSTSKVMATPKVSKPEVQATPRAVPRYAQTTAASSGTTRVVEKKSSVMATPKYSRPVSKPIMTPKYVRPTPSKPIVKETPVKPLATPSKWTRTVWTKTKTPAKPVYKPPAKVIQQVVKAVPKPVAKVTVPQGPKLSPSTPRSSGNLSVNTSQIKKPYYEKPKLVKSGVAKQPIVQRYPVRKNVNASLNGSVNTTLANITNTTLNASTVNTTVDKVVNIGSSPNLSTFERLKRKVESIGQKKFV